MTSFGEIVEPGTRTAWEDWDENVQDRHSKLIWLKDVDVPASIQSLFILEGRHIADSINSFAKFSLELVNVIQEVNFKLYRTLDTDNADIYVGVLRDYDLLLASEILDLLKPYVIGSANVISILTKPLAEYQTTESIDQEYVMRCLSTTAPLPKLLTSNIPKLEQPNIISGVAAGVICLREIMNQSGAAIVCYVEHNEEYQINELQELLNKFNVGSVQPHPNSILTTNLYI